MIKITSKEIQHWTDTHKKESEQLLPELVRRLISSLCETEPFLRIPSGDSTSNPWYDWIVTITKGNGFFPEWKCVIEIWTNKDIKGKAEEDYQKRKLDPKCEPKETNYIFATSRLFSWASDWSTDKEKDKFWKSVDTITADDLEYLLENSLPCSLWFSEILWKPLGLESIDYAWNKFSSSTQKKLIPSILLSGREEKMKDLLKASILSWKKIEVKADSQMEAYGFILASLGVNELFKTKVLVVHNDEDLEFISNQYKNLVIIPRFIPKNMGTALANWHTLIFSNWKEWLKNIWIDSTITLEKMARENKISSLGEILWDKDTAEKVYTDTRGYFYQILRHKSLDPNMSTELKWLKDFDPKLLHTILFLTQWEDAKDSLLVSACLGKDYSEIRQDLERLSKYEDSPIRNVWGNVWQVISKSDLFTLLWNNFDVSLLRNYETVVKKALTDEDTSFELDKKDRWASAIYEKWATYSDRIKQGIADSLCLLADIWDIDTQEYINKVVREIFHTTQDPYRLLYNFGSNIRLLAEASPEIFLDYIEENIDWFAWLFDQWVNDFMHSRSEHVNLMWALEILAWNTEFLPRVSNILIQLAEKYEDKIQSNLSNRPMGSLAEIFILWQRSTSASLEEKIAILTKASSDYPESTFELIVNVLKTTISSTSAKPVYRDWADVHSLWPVTNKEYYDYAIACIDILIGLLKKNTEIHYVAILDIINDFPASKQNEILDFLLTNDFSSFSKSWILEARKNIRELFMREAFYDQKFHWDKDKLLTLYSTINPLDNILESAYIFNGWYWVFVIDRKDEYKKTDFDVQEKIAKEERIKAIKNIYVTSWIEGIKDLLPHLEMQGGLIDAIIDSWILEEKLYDEIFNLLNEKEPSLFTFSINFLTVLARKGDKNFIKSKSTLGEITSEDVLARLILAIDDPKDKFQLLREQTTDVQELFWRDIQKLNWWWLLREDWYSEANYVLSELNKRWLLNISFDILSRISHSKYLKFIDNKIIFEIFTLLVPYVNSGKYIQSIDYYLKEILQYFYALEKEWTVSASDILWLEIQYIKTLENPLMINKALAENPGFFVDMIVKVYKARSEEKKVVSEEEQRIASNVFHILHNFKKIPWTQEDWTIDEEFLFNYIEESLAMLKECDRLEIGSQKIWEVLAHSWKWKDWIWPCEAVRNILDKFKSEQIARGFHVGKSNLRGTTVRWMFDWWEQEKKLADEYLDWAKALRISHPFTSKVLKGLWKDYQYQAKREDIRVQLDTE